MAQRFPDPATFRLNAHMAPPGGLPRQGRDQNRNVTPTIGPWTFSRPVSLPLTSTVPMSVSDGASNEPE